MLWNKSTFLCGSLPLCVTGSHCSVPFCNMYTCSCMCGHTLVIGWSLSISLSEAKSLKDDATLESEGLDDGGVLYFKDLGPQIGWKTVGLQESYNIP